MSTLGTPWLLIDDLGLPVIMDSQEGVVSWGELNNEDAVLIVKAVNAYEAYEALLEAATTSLEWLEITKADTCEECADFGADGCGHCVGSVLRAAIKAVRGTAAPQEAS